MSAARVAVTDQLKALSEHRFGDFTELVARHRSDFRDTGPVLAQLMGAGFGSHIQQLSLVDYADALGAAAPTWVAGALITVEPNHDQS